MLTPARIQMAFDGDRVARTELVRELLVVIKPAVAAHLRRLAGSRRRDVRQDVDDFSHEVVMHLLAEDGRALRAWDPARGTVEYFVRMIARQRVTRKLRGHRGNPYGDDPMDTEALEPLLEADANARVLESRELLRAVLEGLRASLSAKGMEIFRKLYVEERPIAEVAAEFQMTRGALDTWNSRVRRLARGIAAGLPAKPCGRAE